MFEFTETDHDAINVCSPYDGQVIANIEAASEFDVEHTLATAASVFSDRNQWLINEKRLNVLNKIVSIMIDQIDEFTTLITKESGKLLLDSRNETLQSINEIKKNIVILEKELHLDDAFKTELIKEYKVISSKEPIGIVVAIGSYIKPLLSITKQIASAIAAGCPVILSPSTETPLTCLKFIKIVSQAGLPDEWCQALISNNNDIVMQLVSDERIKLFSYSGDVKNASMFQQCLTPGTQSKIDLESATTAIVTVNNNIEKTLADIREAAFSISEQDYLPIQKVFVPVSFAMEFAKGIAEIAKHYVIGDPFSEATDIGPIINVSELNRIDKWVKEAVSMGAKLICGGFKVSNNCYASTVLYNPSIQSSLSQDNIVAPLVCIYPYDDIKRTINRINNTPYDFHFGVFSDDEKEAQSIATQLNVSTVFVNHFNNIKTNNSIKMKKEKRLYFNNKKTSQEKH